MTGGAEGNPAGTPVPFQGQQEGASCPSTMNRVVASGFLEDTCALLERTPRAIRELLAGLPDSWLGEPDVVAGWTARDVVGHLISAELGNWIPRVTRVIEKGTAEASTDSIASPMWSARRGCPSRRCSIALASSGRPAFAGCASK